jgi:hypothetical protein
VSASSRQPLLDALADLTANPYHERIRKEPSEEPQTEPLRTDPSAVALS